MQPLSSEVKKALARNYPSPKDREQFRAILKRNEMEMQRMKRRAKANREADKAAVDEKYLAKAIPHVHDLFRKGLITGGPTKVLLSSN